MTARTEALGKELFYELVDAGNLEQVRHALEMERKGFSAGIDPIESSDVITFLAREGSVWLQYASENSHTEPTGVIEFIPLERALSFNADEGNNKASLLAVIMGNQGRVFQDARRFADDKDLIYEHGISMSRRSRGYGKLLLAYALDNTPNARTKPIICYIDLATTDDTGLVSTPNEISYALHINRGGFVVIGVADSPVYDDKTTHLAVLRPSDESRRVYADEKRLRLDTPDAYNTISNIKELTSSGFVGVRYDIQTHDMTFAKMK